MKRNRIDYNYFWDIIEDKIFYNDLVEILNSKYVKKYIEGYRDFYKYASVYYNTNNKNKSIYDFDFSSPDKDYVENLSKQFDIFMEKIKDINFFRNLFRLKFLPFDIRAITNSNLKIYLNSLYYNVNENIDDENQNAILKAAFKIIIIHEIIHILKYLKKDYNFGEIPKTPRQREGGEMFINYLFGKPIIKTINIEQAKKINNINSWNNLDELRINFKDNEHNNQKANINNENLDHIDMYFSGEGQEENENYLIFEDNGDLDIN